MFKDKLKDFFQSTQEKKINKMRPWLISLIAAIFVLLIIGTIIIWFQFKYQNKIFPGVKIGNINLSKLTRDEAINLIKKRADNLLKEGIKVYYYQNNNKQLEIISNQIDDPELFKEIIIINPYQTANQAYWLGRNYNFFQALIEQFRLLILNKTILPVYQFNEETFKQELKERFSLLEVKELNARPQINCLKNNCQVEILPEINGLIIDYQTMINQLKDNINSLNSLIIELSFKEIKPTITKNQVSNLTEKVLATASSTITFYYQDKQWKLKREQLNKMLEFQKNSNQISIGINQEKFFSWLEIYLSPSINIPAKNITLEIKNNKLSTLGVQQEGLGIDAELLYQELNQKILNEEKIIDITIPTKKIQPEIIFDNVNDLGIKELIGVGKSNFAGSPTNRRKNIANGAKMLHGLLIKPNEEFSLISKLLPIDASNGYLPELVIKGNKTVPEFGGGLCQIGTTMFRAALSAGLPILERQNHSYSVVYYLENGVPGVDATIYDPKPDLIFKNDTGHYILIQSKIEGDNLSFELWGTSDGRQATRTKPTTWNWKDPPPTKYIETTELAPGVKKCTESSHKGVTASFDYIVTSSDGIVKKQTFTSIYKPWQGVCLIGISATNVSSTVSSMIDNFNNNLEKTSNTITTTITTN